MGRTAESRPQHSLRAQPVSCYHHEVVSVSDKVPGIGRKNRDRPSTARVAVYIKEGLPPEQGGKIVLGLFSNAVVAVALYVAAAAVLGVTAVRAWRCREGGLAQAIRSGVPRWAATGLASGFAVHAIVSRRAAANLFRRARAWDESSGASPSTNGGFNGNGRRHAGS